MEKISDLILHKDHHLLALNKPAGMPAQEDKTGDPSLHRIAMAYAHRDLYLIHRLDRRVSGVMLLAKTKEAAAQLSHQWGNQTVSKVYLAFVPHDTTIQKATITHYLTYDKSTRKTHIHSTPSPGADEATLSMEPLLQLDQYTLLRIDLHTGRKHQIRAQLAALGMPIKGDIKYGSRRTNEEGHIDLHAYALGFVHPSRQTPIRITAPPPTTGLWTHIPPDLLSQI